MTKNEKIQAAIELTKAFATGYSSHDGIAPTGLNMGAWRELFENCYDAVGEFVKIAENKTN
jgi:hypothetical protein